MTQTRTFEPAPQIHNAHIKLKDGMMPKSPPLYRVRIIAHTMVGKIVGYGGKLNLPMRVGCQVYKGSVIDVLQDDRNVLLACNKAEIVGNDTPLHEAPPPPPASSQREKLLEFINAGLGEIRALAMELNTSQGSLALIAKSLRDEGLVTLSDDADVLTRQFEGNRDQIDSFLATNVIFQTTDYKYTYMVLDEIEITDEAPIAKATLTFYGAQIIFPGITSSLQTSGRWVPRAVELPTDNPADGMFSVNYLAPTTIYRYTTPGINDTPIYQGASRNPSTITILDSRQSSPGNGQVGPPNPNYVRQGKFLWEAFSVCTDFDYDQRGEVYNYRETWAVTVQKPTSLKMSATSLVMGPVLAPPFDLSV